MCRLRPRDQPPCATTTRRPMDDDFDVFDLFGDGDTSMEFDLDPDAPPPPPPPPQQPPAEKAAKKKKKKKKRDKKKDRGSGESDFSDFDATDLFAPLPPAANAQSTNAPSAEKADKAKALPSAAKAASAGSSPAPAKQASQAEQNAAHKAAASPSAAKQSIGPDGRPMATTLAAPTAAAAAGTPKKAKPAKNVSIASPETGTGNGGEEAPEPEPELESKIPPEVRRAFAAVDKDGAQQETAGTPTQVPQSASARSDGASVAPDYASGTSHARLRCAQATAPSMWRSCGGVSTFQLSGGSLAARYLLTWVASLPQVPRAHWEGAPAGGHRGGCGACAGGVRRGQQPDARLGGVLRFRGGAEARLRGARVVLISRCQPLHVPLGASLPRPSPSPSPPGTSTRGYLSSSSVPSRYYVVDMTLLDACLEPPP